MSDPQEPIPPYEDAQTIIRRARRLWLVCLGLPFVYLGVGLLVKQYFFTVKYPAGFFPLNRAQFWTVLDAFIALALCAELAILLVRHFFKKKLAIVRLIQGRAAELYWRRTRYLAACCDFVSILGLIFFLLTASGPALIGFCVFSYLLYAQSYPAAHFVDE